MLVGSLHQNLSQPSLVVLGSRMLVLATHRFERGLESRDESRNVFDGAILVLVPVVHFLEDVSLVFFELADRVRLDLLDLVSLPLQLRIQLVDQIALLLEALLLLLQNRLFNLSRLFGKVLEDLSFFLDTCVFLSFQVGEVFVHLGANRIELIVEGVDAIAALLRQEVLQVLDAVVATLVLTHLVFVLGVELVLHLLIEFSELLIVPDLVRLERVVHFLAFVHSELLDVLDFLVDVFEFEFKFALFLISLGHHLFEVSLDLDHLSVQATQFFIRFPCLLVHALSLLF
mmetsp:Transcript_31313/g.41446  ORF Transcript_31313/g.41446 Transcript_31313/m.41446 type:complete len:287 (-) Transcript_31313:40-900(-)